MDFVEKYKPQSISDIIGNHTQIAQIDYWLSNYFKNRKEYLGKPNKKKKKINIDIEGNETDSIKENFVNEKKTFSKKKGDDSQHSCLMVTGEHGVGKTCTVHAVLKNLGFMIQTIDLSKIESNKTVSDHIKKITMGSNIFNKMNDDNNIKKAIVIDEIESANSPVEKAYVTSLLKTNEENWYYPIIFISNGKHSPLNSTLKMYSNNVSFSQPDRNELMILLSKLAKSENMKFENIDTGYLLTDHAQNDYRRLVSTLQDIKTKYPKKVITSEDITKYSTMAKTKDINVDIFRAVVQMMIKYKSIDQCLKMYEKEKVIIPLVMHQNYIKTIVENHPKGQQQFTLVNNISKSLAFGDLVENYIYSDQNWDMQEVYGFLACVEPAHKIHLEKLNVNMELLRNSFDFPYDLNRTSIKKINKKNIVNSNQCLKNLEIKDFIFANRLIRQLIEDNKINEIAELFKGYDAKVENIDSILKIDKITETKTVLPTIVKKKLTQLMGVKK